jgi:hypothetical protein
VVAGSTRAQRELEPIAALGQGLNELRVVRGVAEQLAQLIDRSVDRSIEINEGPAFPERAAQALARDNGGPILFIRRRRSSTQCFVGAKTLGPRI